MMSFYGLIQLGNDELLHLPSMYECQEYVYSIMDDGVDDDRLEDMICDVGVDSESSFILDQLVSHSHRQC